jgi:hypothetical protein
LGRPAEGGAGEAEEGEEEEMRRGGGEDEEGERAIGDRAGTLRRFVR